MSSKSDPSTSFTRQLEAASFPSLCLATSSVVYGEAQEPSNGDIFDRPSNIPRNDFQLAEDLVDPQTPLKNTLYQTFVHTVPDNSPLPLSQSYSDIPVYLHPSFEMPLSHLPHSEILGSPSHIIMVLPESQRPLEESNLDPQLLQADLFSDCQRFEFLIKKFNSRTKFVRRHRARYQQTLSIIWEDPVSEIDSKNDEQMSIMEGVDSHRILLPGLEDSAEINCFPSNQSADSLHLQTKTIPTNSPQLSHPPPSEQPWNRSRPLDPVQTESLCKPSVSEQRLGNPRLILAALFDLLEDDTKSTPKRKPSVKKTSAFKKQRADEFSAVRFPLTMARIGNSKTR
ncbi:hypothetical protein O181_015523 [Austropuccinia psidii MF-1]|uniref:Uncharacterized protein n=1 Tax=Austropuccinia psidii MF-1 TaxID=1389203 RepID=A0A9Q3GQ22_9BASI|nr:hypothetical protein [Austropuccinia psidii MF-1]